MRRDDRGNEVDDRYHTVNLIKPNPMIVVSIQLQYHPELAPCFFSLTEAETTMTGYISGECITWKNCAVWPLQIDREIAEELILLKFATFLNH